MRKNYHDLKKKVSIISILCLGLFNISSFAQHKDSINLDEIVVTGTREEVDIKLLPMSVTVISNETIENRQQESILSILSESVPSLFITSRGVMGYGVSTGASGGIKMRGIGGSPTTGMLVLIDGHPQYMGIMGHPMADAYQSWMAEKVEVVRNPASVLYGSNAMGGVINIITKKAKENGVNTNADISYGSYNTLTTELSNSISKNKFTSHISGSYNRSDGHRENMDFEQYGGYAKFGYTLSDNWNITTDLNITHFNASNPGEVDNPIYDNDSRITRGMTSVSLNNNHENNSGALSFFYNWGEHTIDNGYYTGGSPANYVFNSTDNMFGVNLYQSTSLFKGNRITLGADYQRFGGIANNVFNDESKILLVDKHADDVAGYIDFNQSLGSVATFNIGYRYDHNSMTGNNSIPQVGVSLYPSKTGVIKLLASKGFRNPTIKDMYMFTTQNPDLLPESLWNYELTWKQKIMNNKISYEVSVFYINGENMIETMPIDGVYTFVNTGKVENFGTELMLNYSISNSVNLSANYSFLDMKYAVLAAPKHKVYGTINYSKGKFTGSAGIQYINGLYTSISDDGNTTENFTLVNITARYKIYQNLAVYARGENLLNQEYVINSGFPMPGATVYCGINLKF
ncbi:MAG: TonB-dependent receptor [Rikenellaceae bacterium]